MVGILGFRMKNKMKKIVVFASGSGTNAENLIRSFNRTDSEIEVSKVLTNSSSAGVIKRARKLGVDVEVFGREDFKQTAFLKKVGHPDLIVLAGFLWLIPDYLVSAFPKRIINIHPALLPKFGGKGMYGKNVHQAVLQSGDKQSGITIHYVNEHYDEGEIIVQARCEVKLNDSVDALAQRIHKLEYLYLPLAVKTCLN